MLLFQPGEMLPESLLLHDTPRFASLSRTALAHSFLFSFIPTGMWAFPSWS